MTPAELTALLPSVLDIAQAAGREIMRIYQSDFSVTLKSDRSPLTEADLAAQGLIASRLRLLQPEIPLLGEESGHDTFAERRAWHRLWLVDPLDGTREFVKRNGEFSVNIALVEDGEPILGVVHGPALAVSYFAARGCGAYRLREQDGRQPIQVQSKARSPVRVLASRSHGDAKLDRALERLGPLERVSIGSALKFGQLADGSADLYVRRGETSEWDTAAGHSVVLEAGGQVTDLSGRPLRYNERETLINPYFIAYADSSRDWIGELGPL